MMAGIASLVFMPLLAVFFAHTLWAFGRTWPVDNEQALARTVIGTKDVSGMPPRWMSGLVAFFILIAGLWALLLSDPAPNLILTLGGALLTFVFLLRGIAGYTPKWRELTSEEPFASFDKKVYSPLCLGIGLGFAILTIWRF